MRMGHALPELLTDLLHQTNEWKATYVFIAKERVNEINLRWRIY